MKNWIVFTLYGKLDPNGVSPFFVLLLRFFLCLLCCTTYCYLRCTVLYYVYNYFLVTILLPDRIFYTLPQISTSYFWLIRKHRLDTLDHFCYTTNQPLTHQYHWMPLFFQTLSFHSNLSKLSFTASALWKGDV